MIFHTNRLKVRHYRKILPNLLIQAGFFEFLSQNRIRLSYSLQPVAGNCAQTTHTQSGAGEGLTVNHARRKAQLNTAGTNLILEQLLQRLYQFKLQILRQAAHIVMGFYHFCSLGAAFDDVGINGSLSQEMNAVQLSGLFLKYTDKLSADNLSLLFRIRNAFQLAEETLRGIHINQVCMQLVLEYLDYAFRLIFTHQAVVYMHTYQLLTDSLDQHSGHY